MGGDHRLSDTYADAAGAALRAAGRSADADHIPVVLPHVPHARGTEPEPIVAFLRSTGLDATYRHTDVTIADLERAVDRREPPIVDLQAWTDHTAPYRETWDAGHYVVMVGYDDERLYFADPSTMTPDGFGYLTRAELEERWHDLAGDHDERVERMAIFVRGLLRDTASTNPPAADGAHARVVMPASAVALG